MGRGDKRTRRGKIFKGSYGKTRLQRTARSTKPAAGSSAAAAKKSPPAKKTK